jgi:two-component system, OmpR family, alkaline phosphatase synthesis response regulator PhoP
MPSNPRILFVDDDTSLNRILLKILTDQGYHVDVAMDGLTALNKLQSNTYDAAIMDNNLPEMNAIDVLRKVHDKNVTRKVIMITAVDELELSREGAQLGIRAVLAKPFDMDTVISTIDRVCQSE